MPRGGHIEWEAVYQPGKVVAKGYKDGRCILKEVVETAGAPSRVALEATTIGPLTVYTVRVLDHKGRWVPTACVPLSLTVDGPARILGAGNGDPAFRARERPEDPSARSFTIETFGGLAQVLVQGPGHLSVQIQP